MSRFRELKNIRANESRVDFTDVTVLALTAHLIVSKPLSIMRVAATRRGETTSGKFEHTVNEGEKLKGLFTMFALREKRKKTLAPRATVTQLPFDVRKILQPVPLVPRRGSEKVSGGLRAAPRTLRQASLRVWIYLLLNSIWEASPQTVHISMGTLRHTRGYTFNIILRSANFAISVR